MDERRELNQPDLHDGLEPSESEASRRGPRFDRPIADGGYLWHYVDGVSDDGELAIVIIAMQGNPFSPDYYEARQRGPARATDYSSMHVAVYGRRGRFGWGGSPWALDERPIGEPHREADALRIGASTARWEGERLVFDLDERTTPPPHYNPLRRPLRGRVIVRPEATPGLRLDIDARGEHQWWPVAPLARIEVRLEEPRLRFTGHGYHDANAGANSLDASFEDWSWSRARDAEGAYLTYDVRCATGVKRTHAFAVTPAGEVRPIEGTARAPLARSSWRLTRHARVDSGSPTRIVRSLEDGPFYTRALVETRIDGRSLVAVHEALAAHRLRQRWVRFCTRYRMRSQPPQGAGAREARGGPASLLRRALP